MSLSEAVQGCVPDESAASRDLGVLARLPPVALVGHPGGLLVPRQRLPHEGKLGYQLRLAEANMLPLQLVAEVVGCDADEGTSGSPLSLKHNARYCPGCLGKRKFSLDSWELPFVNVCAECESWLVDTCCACGCPVPWKRRRLFYCDCGHYLCDDQAPRAPAAVVLMSRALELRLRAEATPDLPFLSELTVDECTQLVHFLGSLVSGEPFCRLRSTRAVSRLDQTWPITTAAAEVLARWPGAYVDALVRWRARWSSDDGSLKRAFGTIYQALYTLFADKKFEFLRIGFASYVAQHWTGALALRNRRIYGNLPEQLSWLPANAAADRLRISIRQVRAHVARGQLVGEERQTETGRRFLVVSRESIERFVESVGTGLPLRDVAARLGLKVSRLAGMLPRLCPEATRIGCLASPWWIPARWVEDWERLISETKVVDSPGTVGLVPFSSALRYTFGDDKRVASLLKAVACGKLRPEGRDVDQPGVKGLLFKPEVLEQWGQSEVPLNVLTLSVPDAAWHLGVKQEVAYWLARKKFLRTQSVRIGRRMQSRTSEVWLEDFKGRYAFGTEVASSLKTSPRAAVRLLTARGIVPVASPASGCRQFVFTREALERGAGLFREST